MKQPMVVSLKGGASGAEALMYMKSSDGDANKVLIAYSLIYMLPLSAKIPASAIGPGLITDTPIPVPRRSSRKPKAKPRRPNLVAL